MCLVFVFRGSFTELSFETLLMYRFMWHEPAPVSFTDCLSFYL